MKDLLKLIDTELDSDPSLTDDVQPRLTGPGASSAAKEPKINDSPEVLGRKRRSHRANAEM